MCPGGQDHREKRGGGGQAEWRGCHSPAALCPGAVGTLCTHLWAPGAFSTRREKLNESRESERWSMGGGCGRVGEIRSKMTEDNGRSGAYSSRKPALTFAIAPRNWNALSKRCSLLQEKSLRLVAARGQQRPARRRWFPRGRPTSPCRGENRRGRGLRRRRRPGPGGSGAELKQAALVGGLPPCSLQSPRTS